MSYMFTFTQCNNPDETAEINRSEQEEASSLFQRYRRHMRANNDNPDTAPHQIKIGVTDSDGKVVDAYAHKCVCSRF